MFFGWMHKEFMLICRKRSDFDESAQIKMNIQDHTPLCILNSCDYAVCIDKEKARKCLFIGVLG